MSTKPRDAASSAPELSPELEALARRAGAEWVEQWRRELTADGRSMRGGWPGTLSEARQRASRWLEGDGLELDAVSQSALMRKVYDVARSIWRAHSEREDEDE